MRVYGVYGVPVLQVVDSLQLQLQQLQQVQLPDSHQVTLLQDNCTATVAAEPFGSCQPLAVTAVDATLFWGRNIPEVHDACHCNRNTLRHTTNKSQQHTLHSYHQQ